MKADRLAIACKRAVVELKVDTTFVTVDMVYHSDSLPSLTKRGANRHTTEVLFQHKASCLPLVRLSHAGERASVTIPYLAGGLGCGPGG